jgi:ribosomal protein S18 acetylase RimI-like enzyme
MDEGFEIRRASEDDAAAIASVLYESFAEYRPLYTPAGFAATTPTIRQVRARIEEDPVWVALYNGTIVGTVAVVDKGGEGLYVRGMAVLAAARGKGIGRRLLEHVEAFARAQKYERLFLSTTPFLYAAIRLYEQFGFRPTGEGPHDLFGTPLFTMSKCLGLSE